MRTVLIRATVGVYGQMSLAIQDLSVHGKTALLVLEHRYERPKNSYFSPDVTDDEWSWHCNTAEIRIAKLLALWGFAIS